MDVNNLKTNELTYELELRQIENPAQLTVDEKRKLLRGCLKQEISHRSFSEPTNLKQFDVDVKGAYETFNDIERLVGKFSGLESEKKKLDDRLNHLSNRVSRLLAVDSQQIAEKQTFKTKVIALEGEFDIKLNSLLQGNTSTPTNVSPSVSIPQVVPSVHTRMSVPPYKWNIQFNGSTNKESVLSFLERVEELRISRNVSKQELFLSACDIFRGPAWTWFSTNRDNFRDWDEVVIKLKSDFLPYFYEQDLLVEIQNRTMANNERVILYISAMECLFRKLSVIPDEKARVDQIRRNLLPFYINQLALIEINTIAELNDYCKRLEESNSWAERYKSPPSKRNGLLEPDLSTFPASSSNNITYNSNTSSINRVTICWNCDKKGHLHKECRNPRTTFCYGCGRKNIVIKNCFACSKNLRSGGSRPHVDAVTNKNSTSQDEKPQKKSFKENKKAKGKAKEQ